MSAIAEALKALIAESEIANKLALDQAGLGLIDLNAIDRARAALTECAPVDAVDMFINDVRLELVRARAKFPGDRVMTIALAEEFGELAKALLEESAANVRKEAVQTAVMAARVVLDGDGSLTEWRAAKGLDPLLGAAHG